MQDISIKDTDIMDNMKAAKSELEADKVELEACLLYTSTGQGHR